MKIAFYNIGCKVNFAEFSEIQENFKKLGYEIIPFDSDFSADAVFIHTCTVTSQADKDSRKYIRRAVRHHPKAFIGVMGCSSQLQAEVYAEIEGVDAVFGNEEKFHILELEPELTKNGKPKVYIDMLKEARFHSACSQDNEIHTRTALKIQDGCDYFCTYCAVPYARGRSRSMDYNEVISKIKTLSASGVKEIILTGINLGEYNNDSKHFEDLIEELSQSEINTRIRISSIEPNLITDRIINSITNSNVICPHFHIPLQSGTDSILKLMKRRYDTSKFKETIEKINSIIPNCGIGIDVIVGFPGEGEDEFQQAYSFLVELEFSYLHVFSYSDRPVAKASDFPNKVKPAEIKSRTHRLRELSEIKRNDFYTKNLGRIERIIPEHFYLNINRADGWTDNYIKVKFSSSIDLPKDFYKVKLLDIKDDYVNSELID